eukprot:gnl/Spiro4/22964_TR11340_c0_g1_i1.p1 gnl/Spiro4/22964_TR11340_c0_g1~~gnl/Spiro4/22964_TR11340_c0_g1_i1.p1  ORF type:complete len:108 (+),score=28.25 gnl/Spiro4/22964_TR11340_c0_g1_i1:92-415(+)
MPIVHLVLFKFRHECFERINSQTGAVVARIRRLPGVLTVSMGENYTTRSLGYTHALTVTFVSKEAEAAYQVHAEHVDIRDNIFRPLQQDVPDRVLAMDYEAEILSNE